MHREPSPETIAPATLAERLTEDFYRWELRGRGWHLFPYVVNLEPPYRPFFFRKITAPTSVDDGVRPTGTSTLTGGLLGLLRKTPPAAPPAALEIDFVEPEAEPFDAGDFGAVVTIATALPPGAKVTKEAAERLLLSLGMTAAPIAFELVGMPDAISLQFSCRSLDAATVRRQLQAHFPDAVLAETADPLASLVQSETFVVDFGLSDEFMRPLRTLGGFASDPLTGLAGALSDLEEGEFGLVQILFQGATRPWNDSLIRAVIGRDGTPFFEGAPEMPALAREKAEKPIFAAALRVAVQSPTRERRRDLMRSVAAALTPLSRPGSNELIPLTNDAYDDAEHIEDVRSRTTHRSGMILNIEELVALVHLPSETVRVEKLRRELRKTRAAPSGTATGLVLGTNVHRGKRTDVVLPREERMRHVHVIGATGTGKSTFLLNLILHDIENGEGVGLIDPHGDLVNHVLDRIPAERHQDVVLFDAADAEYPVGFNILDARSAGERTLLESDLAGLFRRFASTWGDQMHAVLENAVAAFLRSDRGGTLADLRRFLLEASYRREFLATITDPHVQYYWATEFPSSKGKPEASIVTRLGTFLRSSIIRNILSQQKSRLDFADIVNGRKILLVKLSQGEIGEENAYLLGSLLVSKLHQVAIGRQALSEAARTDWFLYIDEFQNFVTPSLASILSGARKYRLGLILSHQDLTQLKERSSEVLASVLANAGTRICFRLGAQDAKKLAEGFGSFDARDLQNLGRGEAIGRIGRSEDDFNLHVALPPSVPSSDAQRNREHLIALSRARCARPRAEVEAELFKNLETSAAALVRGRKTRARDEIELEEPRRNDEQPVVRTSPTADPSSPAGATPVERPREKRSRVEESGPHPALPTPGRGGREHKYLQGLIKSAAEDRGFRAVIEQEVLGGIGSVDVALEKGPVTIACEISVNSTAEYELSNLQKCLAAGFGTVVLVSNDLRSLERIRKQATTELSSESLARIRFHSSQDVLDFLEEADPGPEPQTTRGYKVKLHRKVLSAKEAELRRRTIAEVLLRSARTRKDKD